MSGKIEKLIELLKELKYKNISVYDISESSVANFLVLATAVSTAENKKNSSLFSERIKYDKRIDGFHKGEWIIFDLDEFVVQLFASGHREKYNIDKLYKGRSVMFAKPQKQKKD